MTREELFDLPKVELHCHLDGSLPKRFIIEKLGRAVSDEELCVSEDCRSLDEYLEKFSLPCQCLVDEDGLERAGYSFIQTVSQEHVIYVEVRFAPLFSETERLPVTKVLESLLKGLERGKKEFGVEYGVLTCAMRHHSEEENRRMLKASREFLGAGVCGADLAGAEGAYPMSGFLNLFTYANHLGMPYTIHAGECGSVENIIDAVEVGARRIGHGIAMRGHVKVQKLCAEKQIGIEMCPISNLQTKAVSCMEEYPMREFLDAGLLVSVNTDNRTVSGSSMTKELSFVQEHYGVSDEEVCCMMKNAVHTSFASLDVKEGLLKKLRTVRWFD